MRSSKNRKQHVLLRLIKSVKEHVGFYMTVILMLGVMLFVLKDMGTQRASLPSTPELEETLEGDLEEKKEERTVRQSAEPEEVELGANAV